MVAKLSFAKSSIHSGWNGTGGKRCSLEQFKCSACVVCFFNITPSFIRSCVKKSSIFFLSAIRKNSEVRTIFFAVVLGFLLSNCAHKVTIESTPAGAQIYSLDAKGNRLGEVGKTPLALSTDAPALEVAKTGFESYIVGLPERSSRITYAIKMQKQSEASLRKIFFETQADLLNNVLSEVIELQTFINQGKFDEATTKAKQMATQYRYVAVYHLLAGHLAMAKKDFKLARNAFEMALELDPKNTEARGMLALVKGARGGTK